MIIKGNLQNENYKIIRYGITSDCNLQCHYCSYYINKQHYYDDKPIERIHEINNFQQKSNLHYLIVFQGGEVLLHPKLKECINELDCKYIIFSNLHFDINYILSFNSSKLQHFNTTYHFQFPNIDKIKVLIDNDISVNVNVMVEHNHSENEIIEKYLEIKELIQDKGTVKLRIVDKFNEQQNKEYYKDMDISKFYPYISKKESFTINNKQENEFTLFPNMSRRLKTKYVYCDIGKYYSIIEEGKYRICNSLDKQLYDNYSLEMDKPIICKNSFCHRCDLRYGTKKGIFIS